MNNSYPISRLHCTSILRNKKVKLLTSADAKELVQRYTSLAETAWIAKLCQTVASLHFGWRKGIDSSGNRRITVVNGGLTSRIRRKYKLNSLLSPCPEGEDPLLWEEKCEKNRNDRRHHALDAMVISFIPGWMRDAQKEHFFRLPETITRSHFEKYLNDLMPKAVASKKPVLAETIYGARGQLKETVITQRVSLKEMAYKSVNMKKVFDVDTARKQVESIRDAWIQDAVNQFLDTKPSETSWLKFCSEFKAPRPDGNGPVVLKVNVTTGKPDEYKDLSKDGKGAYRKAAKSHRGQIVFRDEKNKIRVRPIYIFESPRVVWNELKGKGLGVVGFFQSGCLVKIDEPYLKGKKVLKPGIYKLNTILSSGYAKLTAQDGVTIDGLSLTELIVKSHFKRI